MRTSLQRASDDVIDARANVFSALGDPTRLRIFHAIVTAHDPLSVSAICDRVDLAPNLASHHLQCLRNCNLVVVEPVGRKRLYEVAHDEAVTLLALADECIEGDHESVLSCEVVTEGADDPPETVGDGADEPTPSTD